MSLKKKFSIYSNASSSYILYGSLFVFAALCIVGMAAIILTAYYGVPVGDDYLAIKTYSNSHTWLGEAWSSLMDTGRYLQSLTSSVAYGSLRSHIAVILPLFILVWFYALIYLYSDLAFEKLRIVHSKVSLHLISAASLVLLVTSGQVVDPKGVWLMYQPFYFSSAIVTYTISVLLYLTLFFVFIKFYPSFKKRPWLSILSFFLLAFFMGLYNETVPATLFGFSLLGVVVTYLYKREEPSVRHGRSYLLALLTSSFLALITMYLSPASAARRQATGALQENSIVSPIITKTVTALTQYTFQPLDFVLIAAFALLVYVFILKDTAVSRKTYIKLTCAGGAGLVASILSLVAAVTLLVLGYGVYTALYPRTFLLVQIMFVTGTLAFFVGLFGVLAKTIPSRLKPALLFVLSLSSFVALILVTPHFLGKFARDISGVAEYHTTWVNQDNFLKKAAATNPNQIIYLDDSGAGIGDGFSVQCNSPYSYSTIWLNDGMESYYGVREICSKSDLTKQ